MKLPGEVWYTAAGLAAYFVGAIPFGYVFVRVIKGVDLRKQGSGNVGATNASRALGTAWFFPIFALDFLKGFAPVFWLAPWVAAEVPCDHCPYLKASLQAFLGFLALAGHLFPVYLGFKGGKGVATAGGVVFALSPLAGVVCLAAWGLVFVAVRYISVASVAAALVLPAAHLGTSDRLGRLPGEKWIHFGLLTAFALAVIVMHRSNLGRLRRGEEPRVGFSAK